MTIEISSDHLFDGSAQAWDHLHPGRADTPFQRPGNGPAQKHLNFEHSKLANPFRYRSGFKRDGGSALDLISHHIQNENTACEITNR